MKKMILIFFLALFCTSVFGQQFRPTTVSEMDVTINAIVEGSFSGIISRNDEMELYFLSIQEDKSQDVYETKEYLEIGETKFNPQHIQRNGLRYAYYKIFDLYEYASTPEFKIVRETSIKKKSQIGLRENYDLNDNIEAFSIYKEETDYIESNDPELKSKALFEFDSDSGLESIVEITEWVHNNIEYDYENYYSGIYSAKETYNNRAGVCDEFANLTAAFTRIKGIPTRYITGISFDGQRFGLHGWVEAYLPKNSWIGIDSTYGEAGYVDAAHFSIAKTKDANEAIDFIAKTRSKKTIQIQSESNLEVEINSVKFFENLIKAELVNPEKLEPGELFEITAELKNISGQNAIFPVELALHEKFDFEGGTKLVYLEKGEEKKVSWEARAPQEKIERGYYSYGMILLLPDGNISGNLNVFPGKSYTSNHQNIRAKDISPFIKNNNLELRIELENIGDKKGMAIVEIFFDDEQVEGKEITIGAFEEQILNFIVRNIKPGVILVKIKGKKEEIFQFIIPEKPEEPVIQIEKQAEEIPLTDNTDLLLIIPMAIGLLFILIILIVFALRK